MGVNFRGKKVAEFYCLLRKLGSCCGGGVVVQGSGFGGVGQLLFYCCFDGVVWLL